MALITSSLFSLKRVRKALEKAYAAGCWQDVRAWDLSLAEIMNQAFDDEQRDTKALVAELSKVLKLYKKIVSELPEQGASQISPPRGL